MPSFILGPNGYMVNKQPQIKRLSLNVRSYFPDCWCAEGHTFDIALSSFKCLRNFSWKSTYTAQSMVSLRSAISANLERLEELHLNFVMEPCSRTKVPMNDVLDREQNLPNLKVLSLTCCSSQP